MAFIKIKTRSRCCLVIILLIGLVPNLFAVNYHSHNDYAHSRPLFDALDHNFNSIEADIFLKEGKLLVGHNQAELKPSRTLEALYLEPLKKIALENNGSILLSDNRDFFLFIDLKTKSVETMLALHKTLENYSDLFTSFSDGVISRKAITIIISGNTDIQTAQNLKIRYFFLDGRPDNIAQKVSPNLMPVISENWIYAAGTYSQTSVLKAENLVKSAHKNGYLVRFWGTYDTVDTWKMLERIGVDFINVDKLDEFSEYIQGNN